jgi:UDP-N-acetylmuramyl tripeptide synthase
MSAPDTRLAAPPSAPALPSASPRTELSAALRRLDSPTIQHRRSILTATRDAAAIVGARSLSAAMRVAGRGATSMPGLAAARISPGVEGRIAAGIERCVLVSGTNGKTGTSSLLATILLEAGETLVRNASGANLRQGIATVVTTSASIGGALHDPSAVAVFETDEAALPTVAGWLPGSVLVLTNLFRDQLDRYGETDHLVRLWATMLAERPPRGGVVYCVDDPRLAALVAGTGVPLHGFALAGTPPTGPGAQLTAEPSTCPSCHQELSVARRGAGQVADYSCASCGFRRPEPDCVVDVVENRGLDGQRLRFTWAGGQTATADVALPGPGNAYNAAAAVSAAAILGVPMRAAIRSLEASAPPFGRLERAEVDGRRVTLSLLKNPASMEQLTQIASGSQIDTVLVALNDAFADGRDVSWYWDCSPEALLTGRRFVVAGRRAEDFVLRVRYAVLDDPDQRPPGLAGVVSDPVQGLASAIDATPVGGDVLVAATYTALLAIRASLAGRALVPAMPR